VYLQLTAGNNPIDLSKLTVSYADKYVYIGNLTHSDNATYDGNYRNTDNVTSAGQWDFAFVADKTDSYGDNNTMLDSGETARVHIALPAEAGNGNGGVAVNNWFQIEMKPASGASIAMEKTIPGAIDTIMVLY